MENYQCIAYAICSLRNIQKQHEQITEQSLKRELIYLMDIYSESEIYKKYQQEN